MANKPMRRGVRVWTAISPDFDAKLELWAVRLGVTKSGLINMSAQAGFNSVIKKLASSEGYEEKSEVKSEKK
jgi:hypothetical protein